MIKIFIIFINKFGFATLGTLFLLEVHLGFLDGDGHLVESKRFFLLGAIWVINSRDDENENDKHEGKSKGIMRYKDT